MTLLSYLDAGVELTGRYEWIGSSSLFLANSGFTQFFDRLSGSTGLDAGVLKYVMLLLAGYPLSYIYSKLPSPTLKHAYNFIVGLWIMQNVFMSQWIHSLITIMGTYFLVNVLPNKSMPYLVFGFLLVYISGSHLYRMYVDYMGWSLDFTGPQMLLTIKLSAFAYSVYDGREKAKLEAKLAAKPGHKETLDKLKYAIPETPGLLEYLGYAYCYATVLAGPAFEYRHYIDTVNGNVFKDVGGKPPGRARAVTGKLLTGLFCMIIHQVGQAKFPISDMPTADALSKPFFIRFGTAWLALFCCRMKYYFAWKVADGAAVLAGFGYEGYNKETKKHMWDGVSNIDIMAFELAENMTANTRAWNKMTQGWLQRYVYSRWGNSLVATYFISAFWHGFYPGYYLFFLSVAPLQTTVRLVRKTIRPMFLDAKGQPKATKVIYDKVGIVVNSIIINYLVIPFQMLDWGDSIKVWGSYKFGGHVLVAITYVVCSLLPAPKEVKPAKKTE